MATANTKKWTLRFLTVLFGLLLTVFLEFILQLSGFGQSYDLVVAGKSQEHSYKYSLNSQYIALHYFHHLPIKLDSLFHEDPWFADTEFTKIKPENSYRIFLVGASTTRGFPYSTRNISYSGFVRNILHDVLPDKNIEVINAGYDALSSFGVLDIVRTIADYSPDLIIVYSGHNEFIGHFGVSSTMDHGRNRGVITFIQQLQHSRIYLLNELLLLKLKSFGKPPPSRQEGINLFRVMLDQERIHWDEADHKISETNYELNLQEIAEIGKRKGVAIIFSTLVSNLKDFSPVSSEFAPSLSQTDRSAIKKNLQKGEQALENKKYAEGMQFFKASIAIDPGYAESHFDLARAYEEQSDFKLARNEYQLARENDKIHLRACLRLNQIIRRVGLKNHVPVIEMERAFEQASENGLVGNNLFLEHVHPNINGHLIMADAISHFLAPHNYIEPETHWNWKRLHSAPEYVKASGFDRNEYVHAQTTVGRLLLDFPFFKCKEGVEILNAVQQSDKEKQLIENCFRRIAEHHSL